MGSDLLVCFALLFSCFSLILHCYLLLALWDLQSDYLNSITCADRLNCWVKPSVGINLIQVVFLWASQHFWLTLIPLLFIGWFYYKKSKLPSGETEMYDPANIRQGGVLQKAIAERLTFVGVQAVNFFLILFTLTSKLEP